MIAKIQRRLRSALTAGWGACRFHTDPAKTFVFVVCPMRSGSTLLKALLAVADDVSHLPEVKYEEFSHSNRYANYLRLRALSDKRIVVAKRPGRMGGRIPLPPGFASTRVIFLYREPLDTIRSFYKMTHQPALRSVWDGGWKLQQVADRWCDTQDSLMDSSACSGAYPLASVRYEQLVREPREVTRSLFQFIGSSRTQGTDSYDASQDYEWRWNSDDGGDKIKQLKVAAKVTPLDPQAEHELQQLVSSSDRIASITERADRLIAQTGVSGG